MKTMKKTAAIAALMLCCILPAFGLGRENLVDSFTITSEDKTSTITINIYRVYGLLYASARGMLNTASGKVSEAYSTAIVGQYCYISPSVYKWMGVRADDMQFADIATSSKPASLWQAVLEDQADAALVSILKEAPDSAFNLQLGVFDEYNAPRYRDKISCAKQWKPLLEGGPLGRLHFGHAQAV